MFQMHISCHEGVSVEQILSFLCKVCMDNFYLYRLIFSFLFLLKKRIFFQIAIYGSNLPKDKQSGQQEKRYKQFFCHKLGVFMEWSPSFVRRNRACGCLWIHRKHFLWTPLSLGFLGRKTL